MLEHNACFSDEDRRFKVVCPFLLLGIEQLFQLVVLVKNKKQQIKNVDVQSYNTEQKRGESYSLIKNTNRQQQERFDRQDDDLYDELYFDDSPYWRKK